ncbi:serine-rich adhesin for platelets [Sabethes cyaneus]|uniref:serine-rich adhesin for platelets n=1 Tax=Sabethes cyaneus TaxID=53552 RepID=UPI00237E8F39|nr:serine-rich adhesin for platelets [Sabethes cyaneus]XP_053684428.1 serine-rich adhesin for platelets [Sabethes cyaneus]XP_053684437.1 serine-rich adhesin for platelets [Sabethes cyaneus]XP_053684446.1 serine-rich adhesin for platelets [Sabethes cyaneus]
MNINSGSASEATSSTTTTTTTATSVSPISPPTGTEEEEESTLVEVSPSSSSSSPLTSSRTSSTGAGDDVEPHPEVSIGNETSPNTMAIGVHAASTDTSEASTVALVEDLPPQQQFLLAPVAVQVASDQQSKQQSRHHVPFQNSSSLSTPSSSEEFDESVATSSTEGALNVSSSNNLLNNNSNVTGNSEQQATGQQQSVVESVLLSSPIVTVVTSTPERAAINKEKEEQSNAPIEIVQIFPSTATSLFSSATSSTFSSSPSTSSTSPTSSSSTSSSPSVSPLAVDQQTIASSTPPSTQVQAEILNEMKDVTFHGTVPESVSKTDKAADREPNPKCPDTVQSILTRNSRPSTSSSPQLHSNLKKRKSGNLGAEIERRRVSFPQDTQLVTGYLEPIDPWACVTVIGVPDLIELYKKSCGRHGTEPLSVVLEHLKELDLSQQQRVPLLSLRDQNLTHGSCEALEEVFKRVQYRCINVSHAGLDDTSASVLFDMIEYYEATNELDFSDNLAMTNKSWLACMNMVKKSQALNVLITRGPGISEYYAKDLATALNTSAIHTLKLEHCELSQRPLMMLCNVLKGNTVLRELSLAYNQLTWEDAKTIATLLQSNRYLQLLDISNNNIGDNGVELIVNALIEQSIYFKTLQEAKPKPEFSIADLSSSLNSINSNKSYFPNSYSKTPQHVTQKTTQRKERQRKKQIQQQLQPGPVSNLLDSCLPTETTSAVLLDATPMTPPPTPALPCASTPSEDVFLTSPKLTPPQVVQSQEKKTPPISPSHIIPENAASELTKLEMANSTNDDSGINSSVSSDVEQTNSDNCNNDVKSSVLESEQKKALSENLLETRTASSLKVSHQERKHDVIALSGKNTDEVNDSGGGKENVPINEGDIKSVELMSDVELVEGPKKAKLAKQDSVTNESELSISEISNVKVEIVAAEQNLLKIEDPVDEDTPEVYADYDDDSSLKIVEENLLVDRSINASTSEEVKQLVSKGDVAENGKSDAGDNDDGASLIRVPLKKDELQLLLESKSKKKAEQEREVEITKTQVLTAHSSEITEKENVNVTSAPKQMETIPLKIVEMQDKPLSSSLDSACLTDFNNSFLASSQPPSFPTERSFSSESLNSETSVDSNDSKSSLKIMQSKFAARNGTLERQHSSVNKEAQQTEQSLAAACGLQVLVLWNNEITRNSSQNFADLIENTSTLEILNVGCNLLCNDFVANIKDSLKSNTSLTSLGLQGAHLSDNGAKAMAEVIEFGGNSTLQWIDLRNNNILATGLDYLNEALKSNKTVTRIDLDDVPRRAMENSIEVGSEYSRFLNNIRAQCERNKHPPEQTEPISTSIKRVRDTHLGSRKISLTCTSIRAPPSATGSDKHHHHLLDPSKKNGGRLRSPLPSPIPSPSASPVPSPSRNRFQVTRVGESAGSSSSLTSINNNTSTSPSPSSTGSSPTLFFAANSRFRVVTVEEPLSSSVANYSQKKSSSVSPSPLAVGSIGRMPSMGSNSAPALSSYVNSPKFSSSSSQTVANIPSPTVLAQQTPNQVPQQQNIPQHPIPFTTTTAPATPKSRHTRIPSTSNNPLNDSLTSTTSVDSPDLEVKRFMSGSTGININTVSPNVHSSTMDDSCCSSISSSIGSIDNVQFPNVSISSADESFDLVVSSPSSSSLTVSSISTAPLKTPSSQPEDCKFVQKQRQRDDPPAKDTASLINVNLLKVKNNSLSSLEMSISSQESLYDVHDLSSATSSGCSPSQVGGTRLAPPTSENSNESTLTSVQSLEKDKQAVTGKPSEKPPRIRKTSWIASLGNHPKSDSNSSPLSGSSTASGSTSSGYSPAIEKLLAIFISPSNLFSSSKCSPPSSESSTVSTGTTGGVKESTSNPPSRKESPMGGLFQWSKSTKDEDKVLKVNVSPENTITPQQVQPLSHSPQAQSQSPMYCVEHMPTQLKAEIKENISPENTITRSKLLANPLPSSQASLAVSVAPIMTTTTTATQHPKVIFHLGDDYDDSEDDIDTLTSKYGGGASSGVPGDFNKLSSHQPSSSLLGSSAGSTTTNSSGISISSQSSPLQSSILQTSHLGQLARDSLVTMFKNPSLASQDSMRSMDSLTEATETIQSQTPQQPDTGNSQAQ